MKVVLYMAITANGYIAKEDGDTSWVSDSDWGRFIELTKKFRNMVIGRKTYEAMLKEGQFPLADCHNIVMTSRDIENKWGEKVIFTNESPREVMKLVEETGCADVLLAGGGHLNGSFMAKGLVDEIYLTIEPIVFGKGIKLFSDTDFENKLELADPPKAEGNEIQLHYRVKK